MCHFYRVSTDSRNSLHTLQLRPFESRAGKGCLRKDFPDPARTDSDPDRPGRCQSGITVATDGVGCELSRLPPPSDRRKTRGEDQEPVTYQPGPVSRPDGSDHSLCDHCARHRRADARSTLLIVLRGAPSSLPCPPCHRADRGRRLTRRIRLGGGAADQWSGANPQRLRPCPACDAGSHGMGRRCPLHRLRLP